MGYELRMYGMVPYNISPIQQGIQFGHAVVEYGLQNFDNEDYQKWAKEWKTFIILNGGTTNINKSRPGTLNTHWITLLDNNILTETFHEPDLGDQLTAIVFIVDERVFNKELYPDLPVGDLYNANSYIDWRNKFNDTDDNINKIVFLREFLAKFRLA